MGSPETSPAQTAKARVLVVDDNHDSAHTMAMIMKIMGNETRVAHCGEEALEIAAEFHPQFMLLDIGMPEMSGHEVCKRIRQQPWGAEMVLIALTGWGEEDDRNASEQAGFDHHLVKPVEPDTLRNILAEAAP